MPAGSTGDERGRRLRDLGPRGRLVATLVGLLLVLPVAVSAGRAIADGWVPSGDEAVIAVRVHDVLSTDPPLTGLPSTSDLYGTGIRTRHLGPIEFYLLALPVRLVGPPLGLLLGAGAITAAALLVTAWVVLRRAGPGMALGVSVLLACTVWSTGTAVLTDPISSNVGGYPLLAAAVLVWALLLGDLRLLPLTVGFLSFAAQQHLAMVIPSGALAVVAVVAVAMALRTDWPDGTRRAVALRWVGASVAVAAVLWLPVAIDQATGHPGNLTAVLRFSGDDGRASLGAARAVDAVLRSAGAPPLQLARNVTGKDLTADLGPVHAAVAIAILAGMAALPVIGLTVTGWRRLRPIAALGPVALALAAAGFAATTSVPDSFESERINLYRWSWALAFVVWWAAGWLVAGAIARWGPTARVRTARPYVAVASIAAVVVASLASVGPDDRRRDADAFPIDRRLGAVVARTFDDEGPVVVVDDGKAANLSVVPALIARLVDEGTTVQVPEERVDAYGDGRAFDPRTVRSVLLVASRFGGLDGLPGRELDEVRLDPRTATLVDRLVTASRSAPIRRSAEAPALRRTLLPGLDRLADHLIARMAVSPSETFTSPLALHLLLDGYLTSPRFGHDDLRAMLDALPITTLWSDDRVAVHRLTLAQLGDLQPDLFRSR
jgi:hypothetical protein